MRVTILAPGSRGDVQPYIAIGQALRALGHACTLVTTLDHIDLVRGYGLGTAALGVDVAAELGRVETNRAVEGGGVIASFRAFSAIAERTALELARVGLEACRGADVIVTNFSTAVVAEAFGRKLGIPVVQAFNVPVTPTSAFPGALLPRFDTGAASRRLGHRLTRAALWMTTRALANKALVEGLGQPPAPTFPGGHPGLIAAPLLYGFSEAFLPRPTDWPADVRVTGFWFVEEKSGFEPPDELARFIDGGPPPVCVGFGSMSTEKPEQVSALVIEAAKAARVRLVLLSGWAGLKPEMLSRDVVTIRAAPHTWLYPRCRAVVHHGGAGTTAAAVQAGVPAVVVPFHGDQPFWAQQVHRLGLGPAPVPRRALTAERLAHAIAQAISDDAMRARAQAVGERVRAEQGAMNAAVAITQAIAHADPQGGRP